MKSIVRIYYLSKILLFHEKKKKRKIVMFLLKVYAIYIYHFENIVMNMVFITFFLKVIYI